ncbi:hypothetical protein EZV62_019402 [Acer yangbiense]|uniref:Protein kinase domain-containing protein n=1 Tax=Acer yangbiense TaxID=1000413 RepID=A0A5C7HD64_9ROSI|nr:hypothetical protein EZV62_019402 [Acer yangbiense]
MEWTKVRILYNGSYGLVTLTVNSKNPNLPPIAMKSSRLEDSHSLEKEKRILDDLHGSPRILMSLGNNVWVQFMKKGYVHCDLKPENILIVPLQDGTNYLKIADFELAKEPREEMQCGNSSMFRFHGTPLYMSPESFLFGQIKSGLDIWSLSCVVVEMLTGKHVMQWLGGHRGWNFVLKEPYILEMSFLDNDFLRKCLARNLKDQWTA